MTEPADTQEMAALPALHAPSPLQALQEYIARRRPAMVYYTLVRVGDPRDAEDIVQQALFRAWRFLPSPAALAQYRSIGRWVFTLLHNEIVNWRRQGAARGARELCVFDDPDRRLDAPVHDDPLERLAREQACAFVRRTVSAQQAAVVIAAMDGAQYAEIARDVGLPIGVVRTTLHRARLRLREARDKFPDYAI